MALINEEFERCEKCGGGYFIIKRKVLVVKGSSSDNPVIYEELEDYECDKCTHIQYTKRV